MIDSLSEQHKEAAKKLRDGGVARNVGEAYTLILSCVGIRPQLPAETTYTDAMARLADLIDPTCEVVEDEPCSCHCTACGRTKMYPLMGWNYCPYCGARVVRVNE